MKKQLSIFLSAFAILGLVLGITYGQRASATPGANELISVDMSGNYPTKSSTTGYGGTVISGNGRYVLFDTQSPNIVASDTSTNPKVYRRDTVTGTTVKVSNSTTAYNYAMAISNDGRYALYMGDGATRSFTLWDAVTGTRVFITAPYLGGMSADGRYIVYGTDTSQISGLDTHGKFQVYVKDMHTSAIKILSVDSTGNPGTDDSFPGGISCDGGVTAFRSRAINLPGNASIPAYPLGFTNLFISHTGWSGAELKNVTNSTSGLNISGDTSLPQVSCDGNALAYRVISFSTDYSIFKYNRLTGTTTTAAHSSLTSDGYDTSGTAISGDGRFIAYTNYGSARSSGYVYDSKTNSSTLMTLTTAGVSPVAGFPIDRISISADGSKIAYMYKTPSSSDPAQELISGVNTGATGARDGVYATTTDF